MGRAVMSGFLYKGGALTSKGRGCLFNRGLGEPGRGFTWFALYRDNN